MNKISSVLLICIIGLSILLLCRKDGVSESTDYNASFIGRRGDTIKVFSVNPEYYKIYELRKVNNIWCLYGDTSKRLDDVEIVQESRVSIVLLKFKLNDSTYVFKTKSYRN